MYSRKEYNKYTKCNKNVTFILELIEQADKILVIQQCLNITEMELMANIEHSTPKISSTHSFCAHLKYLQKLTT